MSLPLRVLAASLAMCLLPSCVGSVGGDLQLPMKQLQQKFLAFENLSNRWMMNVDEAPSVRRRHLEQAFREIETVLDNLATATEFPQGLDPAGLAARVIFLRQTAQHGEMAIPLLQNSLDRYYVDGAPLGEHCSADRPGMRRGCQDLYSLLCFALQVLAGHPAEADTCLEEYNHRRPTSRQFLVPIATHRQLPGLRAQPWWEQAEVPFASIKRIASHGNRIAEEISRVTGTEGFDRWDQMAVDPTLALNAKWDPYTSWDAIPLFFDGDWDYPNCALFPLTCAVLHEEEEELQQLFNRTRFNDLVPLELRDEQEYDEVPTLGVKICELPRSAC